jgi:hypothetical protein
VAYIRYRPRTVAIDVLLSFNLGVVFSFDVFSFPPSKPWCGASQLVARRLAVRQARVRFSARHHREGLPTELSSDEEMEKGPSEWRRINVLYKCD